MAGLKDPCIDKGRPLQVVRIDEKGITLNKEELSILLERDDVKESPLAIISIAGLCRTGKSFLLNFMLRYLMQNGEKGWIGSKDEGLEGFPWRQGVDPTTRGIYMWSKPFHTTTNDGKQMSIILMDTEGLFDSSQDTDDCSAVFALSALISSTQVFNVVNKIEEPHLKQLELYLEISRMILTLVRKERSGESFQRFVWLIRDWIDAANYKYGEKGGQKYLDLFSKGERQPMELKKLWKSLESSFKNFECYLMPHPGLKAVETDSREESSDSNDEEDSYASSDSDTEFIGQPKKLKRKFRKNLKKLVPYLLDPKHLSVKQIGEIEINGKILLNYMERYVEVLKSQHLPKISSPRADFVRHFDSLLVIDLSKTHEIYVDRLSENMKGVTPYIYPDRWESDLSVQEQQMRNQFEEIARGDPDFKKKKSDEFERQLSSLRRDLCELINKLNFEELQKEHQGRAKQVRDDMKKRKTLDSKTVEKAILKEERLTKNNLKKLECGDSKQRQQLDQSIKLCFISNRLDIDEDFNNRIICSILKDHRDRISKMLAPYKSRKVKPDSKEIKTALEYEEGKTRMTFNKDSRGDPKDENMSVQHMEKCFSTHRKAVYNDVNNLIFEEVLSSHIFRAEKLYNINNSWRLLYTLSKLNDDMEKEEQNTINSFDTQAMGDSTDKKCYSYCLKEHLKYWKRDIINDQELKRKTWKEGLEILKSFIISQHVFEDYLKMAELFREQRRANSGDIIAVAMEIDYVFQFAKKIEKYALAGTVGGAVGTISAIFFPWLIPMSIASSGLFLSGFFVIYNRFLAKRFFNPLREQAYKLLNDCRGRFEATEKALRLVIDTVKHGSQAFNKHKILNILFSVTAVKTPPEEFFKQVTTYLMDPSMAPPMYIADMGMSGVIKDRGEKVFRLKHVQVINWGFYFDVLVDDGQILLGTFRRLADDTRIFGGELLRKIDKDMNVIDEKLVNINSILTQCPQLSKSILC